MVENRHNNYLFLIFESLFIGVITGLIITAFRFSVNYISLLRLEVFAYVLDKRYALFIFVACILSIAGLFVGFIIKKYPMIKGGGVAQIEGVFMQKLKMTPFVELPLKFLGGLLGIGLGLSVGREGPSVQIGAYVGDAVEKLGKRSFVERVCLITAGAASGLSATFSAPFAGVVFALEDLHQYFSPLLLACIMAGSFAADFTASLFFGAGGVFHFNLEEIFPLSKFIWLAGLGIIVALIGDFFKKSIYFFQDLYKRLNIPAVLRPLVPFLLTIPVGIFCSFAAGGGDELIEALANQSFTLKFLLFLLAVKIIFTGISAGSGAVGGIFVPLFACGALGGVIYAKVLIHLGFLEPAFTGYMLVFGMAACFTTVIKAPLTACVLVFETGGGMNHLGGLVLTCLSAYITANLIGSKAHDHVLLAQILAASENENHLKDNKAGKSSFEYGKQIFELPVHPHSFAETKKFMEIRWPDGSIVIGIVRGESEFIPDGNTVLYPGDKLIFLAEKANSEIILQELKSLTKPAV